MYIYIYIDICVCVYIHRVTLNPNLFLLFAGGESSPRADKYLPANLAPPLHGVYAAGAGGVAARPKPDWYWDEW